MKIKYYILSIVSVVVLSSCSNLDYNEVQMNDEEWLFTNQAQVQRLLFDIYAQVRYDMGDDYIGAMLASATDESDCPLTISLIHRYYNGAWSSVNSFPTTWNTSYQAIRQANAFLEDMDKVMAVLDDYKYNQYTEYTYEDLVKMYERFPYEARFLRAYFYFELAKTYGDVPLVTKTLTPTEANSLRRTPVQEVFDFIVKECDLIANFLPITYINDKGSQVGRVNRATVQALKARTLIYAASPLHQPANPKEAWRKAAVACKEIIDNRVAWDLSLSAYNTLWGPNNHSQAKEIIWIRRISNTNRYQLYNYPAGNENVLGGNCPSQTLVDAYEYSSNAPVELSGKTWPQAELEGILPANPYANLDPRFALTVARTGDTWPTTTPYNANPLQTFEGGRNGPPILNATRTGYYLKKYLDGSRRVTTADENSSNVSWIIYRLGEVYLNYAEAMFNYMDRDATAIGDGILDMSANDAINVLRNRSGIAMPLFGSETNGNIWEERYMRERMVELAFESHRFWDVRRWKKGPEFFTQIKTIKVTPIPGVNNEYTYERGTPISRGTWNDKYYLYPIPFSEIQRATNLEQNPGW